MSAWSTTNVPDSLTNYVDQQTLKPDEWRRLRSVSSTSLDVRRTRLSTVGDRAFPVANSKRSVADSGQTSTSLLQPIVRGTVFHRTSLLPFLSIFCCRLKLHLFSLSYPTFWLFSYCICTVPAQWLVILDIIIIITFNILVLICLKFIVSHNTAIDRGNLAVTFDTFNSHSVWTANIVNVICIRIVGWYDLCPDPELAKWHELNKATAIHLTEVTTRLIVVRAFIVCHAH